jgi:hypothetical protein
MPKTRIVIEKKNTINATIVPKPAKGTPIVNHKTTITMSAINEVMEVKTPNIETQAKGNVL